MIVRSELRELNEIYLFVEVVRGRGSSSVAAGKQRRWRILLCE